MVLGAFQAGLSWSTILRKRENLRVAFDNFDPHKVAGYGEQKLAELLADASFIRNRAKINATVTNAKAMLQVQADFGSYLQASKSIAIQCRAGIGRSASLAAALLCLTGLTTEEAFAKITQARGLLVPDTMEQRQWVSDVLPSTGLCNWRIGR